MDIQSQKLTRASIKQAMDANSITRREHDLLLQLSDADLSALVAAYEDGKFVGFGTVWHDQFTQWADPQRSEIVAELETLHRERLAKRATQTRGKRQPGWTAAYAARAASAGLSQDAFDRMWDAVKIKVPGNMHAEMGPDGVLRFVPNK